MRVIDLDGNSTERGRLQGEALRSDFGALFRDLLSSTEWREHKPPFLPEHALRPALAVAGRALTWPFVRRRVPRQAARLEGLATGLGVSTSFAWGLQLLEVVFCQAGSSLAPPPPVGCTVLQATPAATIGGKTLVARNYDFPNLLRRYQVVRREVPTEAHRLATTTITQCALVGAHQGVNEVGLAVSVNNARLWLGEHLHLWGVPLSLLAQEVLETCRTTAEALRLVEASRWRANAGFVGLADASGDTAMVEYTVRGTTVRRPDANGVLAQANHFTRMTHANLPEGTRWTVEGMRDLEYLVGSRARQGAAQEILEAAAGSITVTTLMRALADHAGHDSGDETTICAHGHSGGTLAGMVVDVGARSLWISDGHPCSHRFAEVSFRTEPAGDRLRPAAK